MDLRKADCNIGMEECSRNIKTKQFQILTDINLIWDFMVEIYGRNFSNGVAAPFYEYAITSTWMDISYQYLNRIWFDGDKVVAFVFTESPVTSLYGALMHNTRIQKQRIGSGCIIETLRTNEEAWCNSYDGRRERIL